MTSGYLPPDSPLKLAKDKRYIKIDGEKFPVHAKIVQIKLSGHADQAELVQLIRYLKPKRTVLVHGDLKEVEALSKQVCELTEVSVPEKKWNHQYLGKPAFPCLESTLPCRPLTVSLFLILKIKHSQSRVTFY